MWDPPDSVVDITSLAPFVLQKVVGIRAAKDACDAAKAPVADAVPQSVLSKEDATKLTVACFLGESP